MSLWVMHTYVVRSLSNPMVQVMQVHWSFGVFVPEGIPNITTMVCGSKRAHLCSGWWRTSSTWPWGSNPSPRNRGGHTSSLSFLALSPSSSCVSQLVWFCIPAGWSRYRRWRESLTGCRQDLDSNSSSSRARVCRTSAPRSSSTSSF